MRAKIFFTVVFFCLYIGVKAQVYVSRNATIRFFSEAPLENIEAINRQVSCAINTNTGDIAFRVLIRSFVFDKALMQQHFNDNFMESDKYPNAIFEGQIENVDAINFAEEGVHNVVVKGKLTIKDVTREITQGATLITKGNLLQAESVFIIEPEHYNVSIPGRFARNIAREIEVSIDATLNTQP